MLGYTLQTIITLLLLIFWFYHYVVVVIVVVVAIRPTIDLTHEFVDGGALLLLEHSQVSNGHRSRYLKHYWLKRNR